MSTDSDNILNFIKKRVSDLNGEFNEEMVKLFRLDKKIVNLVLDGVSSQKADHIKQQLTREILENFDKNLMLVCTSENNSTINNSKDESLISKIYCISSCKGGVGKSTITVLIAYYLSRLGYKVGIVDADIYGPSIPILMGVEGKHDFAGGKIIPKIKDGLKISSIGLIADNTGALVWRGPMVTKALKQLVSGVAWGELDYLLVDTPPGTGDIFLSLAENYKVDGALLVTTANVMSVSEINRSIDMFNKLKIKTLGLIENMSSININGHKKRLFSSKAISEASKKLEDLKIGEIEYIDYFEGDNIDFSSIIAMNDFSFLKKIIEN